MKIYDLAVFGLLAATIIHTITHYDHDTMHVVWLLAGVLTYMYYTRNTAIRFNPIFGMALVCVFGVCMALYSWLLYMQESGPALTSTLLVLAYCGVVGIRLVPAGVVACIAMRQTGRPA